MRVPVKVENFIKKLSISFFIIGSLMVQAADDIQQTDDRHRPLSSSSATVGCTGITFYNYGPLGDLMRGPEYLKKECDEFEKVMNQYTKSNPSLARLVKDPIVWDTDRNVYGRKQQEKGLGIRHNHPGVTVDIAPAVQGIKNKHFRIDWIQYKGNPGSFEDIFLEQLPPAGDNGENPGFMPSALSKANNLLRPNGRLVIHLALDVSISSNTKEQLVKIRSTNPFIFEFNNSVSNLVAKYFAQQRQGNYSAAHPVVQAVAFYEQKLRNLLEDAFGDEAGKKKYNILYDPYKLITNFDVNVIKDGSRGSEILMDIYRLVGLFVHKDRMINYLNDNGFRDAQLEWLDVGKNFYSPSGGWFITTFKK